MVLLVLLPAVAMAQWGSVSRTNSSSDNNGKGRFTVGIHFTGDAYKNSFGFGGGLLLNFGNCSDLVNVVVGAEYIEYLVTDPRPDETKGGFGVIDGGGQLVVPAAVKLLFLRTSKWSKVYVGLGGEMGFRVHENKVLGDYYPEKHPMCEKSVAIVPMFGCRSQNLDFGIYYKHYVDKPFNNSIDGKKDLGKDDKRIGCYLTWFF